MSVITLNIEMKLSDLDIVAYIKTLNPTWTDEEAVLAYNAAVATEMDFFDYFDGVLTGAGLTADEVKAQFTGILNLWANYHGIMPTP